ncbi:RloB family protein [Streptomyces nodosus]|uniref:RloB family protein n=1 Tax=Streptomyces nodosus TaxID=40318 RepID=UPI0036EBA31C
MKKRQLKGSQKLTKAKSKRIEHRKVLIAAEGTNTEPQYFEGLAKVLNAKAVRVLSVSTVGVGRDPLRIITEADRRRKLELKSGDGFDEVWAVLDVDRHANLEPACIRARKLLIDVAISSPCFEIWLVWHYEEWAKWSKGKTLQDLLKRSHGFKNKNLPHNFPYANYELAVARAEKCEVATKVYAPPNPHSSVSALVRRLNL